MAAVVLFLLVASAAAVWFSLDALEECGKLRERVSELEERAGK